MLGTIAEPPGRDLRRRRRFLDLTQAQLGALVGVNHQKISAAECGEATARLRARIAAALDEVERRAGISF